MNATEQWWRDALKREWALLDAIGAALVAIEHAPKTSLTVQIDRTLRQALEDRPDPDKEES